MDRAEKRTAIEKAVFAAKDGPLVRPNGKKGTTPTECACFGKLKPKQIRNGVKYVAPGLSPEEIVIFCDETLSSSGKKGILFAENGYYDIDLNRYNKETPISQPIRYAELAGVEVDTEDDSYFYLVDHKGGRKKAWGSIYTCFIVAALNNILTALDDGAPSETRMKLQRAAQEREKADQERRKEEWYRKGLDLKKDKKPRKAIKWFVMSGKLGHIKSMEEVEQYVWDRYVNCGKDYTFEQRAKRDHYTRLSRTVFVELRIYWLQRMVECGDMENGYLGITDLNRYSSVFDDSLRLLGQEEIIRQCRKDSELYGLDYPFDQSDAYYWEQQVAETKKRIAQRDQECREEKLRREAAEFRIREGKRLYEEGMAFLEAGDTAAGECLAAAAEQGYAPALDRVLKVAAETGSPAAQCELGRRCLTGADGAAQDETAAVAWFERASGQGHMEARYRLALCRLRGLGGPADKAESIRLLREAAEGGCLPARIMVGDSFCHGENRDPKQAEYWLLPVTREEPQDPTVKAAIQEAWLSLAMLYSHDSMQKEPDADTPRALDCVLKYLELKLGDKPVQANVLPELRWRDLIDKARQDSPEMLNLLKFASKKNSDDSTGQIIWRVVDMYEITLYLPRAESGNADAMNQLYHLYGRFENDAASKLWGRRALEARQPDMLLSAYENPREWGLSDGDAINCLIEAAKKGNEDAQTILWLKDREEEDADRHAEQVRRYRESQAYEAEQAYQARLDMLEREFSGMTTGEWRTVEEQALSGQISQQDFWRHQAFRDALENAYNKD